jgi:hypothetical protein
LPFQSLAQIHKVYIAIAPRESKKEEHMMCNKKAGVVFIVILVLILLGTAGYFVWDYWSETDAGLFEMAMRTNNTELCWEIRDKQLMEACLHPWDPCLIVLAKKGRDAADKCYFEQAVKNIDVYGCGYIHQPGKQSEGYELECERAVMDKIIEKGDASLCKDRTSCLQYLAFYTNDVSYCESREPSQLSPQCVSPEDEEIKEACEKMEQDMIKDCKLHIPGQQNILCSEKKASDPDFYKTSTEEDTEADNIMKNDCILIDAAATLDPALCDFIVCEDEGEICFEKTACEAVIAIKSKDINKCNDLKGGSAPLFKAVCQNDASKCNSLSEMAGFFCTALINSDPEQCSKTLSMSSEIECKTMYDFISSLLK